MVESLAGRKVFRKPVRRVYIAVTTNGKPVLTIEKSREVYPPEYYGIPYKAYVIVSFYANVRAIGEQTFKTFLRGRKQPENISIPEARINPPFEPYIIHELGDFSSMYTIVKLEYVTKSGKMVDYYFMTFKRATRFRGKHLACDFLYYYRSSISNLMDTTYNDDQVVHAMLI